MIINARMYSVSPEVSDLWRRLLTAVVDRAQLPAAWLDYPAPAPVDELWRRDDMTAVFMCGLPFARAIPRPTLVAAPVPAPAIFGGQAQYWSEFVVAASSPFGRVEQTFGQRLALTVPGSQSGCVAALSHFMTAGAARPLFKEIIAPQITPLGVMGAVIRGEADVGPIDAYSYALLQRYRPDLTGQLRVIGRTVATANPPLVSSEPANEALRRVLLELDQDAALSPVMEGLLLSRFVLPSITGYDELQNRALVAQRYWQAHPLAEHIHPAFALP